MKKNKFKIIKECFVCHDNFERYLSALTRGRGKYCSKKCMAKDYSFKLKGNNNPFWKDRTALVYCQECNLDFVEKKCRIENGRGKFCSMKCKGIWQSRMFSGKNHYNWQGGITPKNQLERVKFIYSVGKNILKRDNYTCQICKIRGGYLHVDHIKGWSPYPELRFNLDNCRTLCVRCHYFITFNRIMPLDSKWGIGHLKKYAEEL